MTTASCTYVEQDTGHEAIEFVLRCIRNWGFDVQFSDTLTGPYAVDRATGVILLPNGLPWRQAHSRINRGWLYMLGGSEWAREFQPQPPAVLAPVIPLIRQVW